MTTPVVRIKPMEFVEVSDKELSLDEYKALRESASHSQALEVLLAGNIRFVSYLRCRHYGETHEDILDFADNSDMKKKASFSLTPGLSIFDTMVRDYVGPGVSLKDAFIARMHGIPNGNTVYKNIPFLREVLEYTTIENLV